MRSSWGVALVLTVATVAVFWPVCNADFINWDDHEQITLNPDFQNVRAQRLIEYWRGPYMGSLYPVSYTVMAIQATIARVPGGAPGTDLPNPRVYHVTTLVLHVLSVWIVFGILKLVITQDWAAGLGALLFAIHPVQVEGVGWVSGQNTVLCGTLSLLAIWVLLLATKTRASNSQSIATAALSALATLIFFLALASKPSAVVVPGIAFVLLWWMLGRDVRRALPVVIVWVMMAVPFMLITRHLQTAELVTPTPLWSRPVVALDALGFYVLKLILPVNLLVDYGRSPAWLMHQAQRHYTWIIPAVIGLVLLVFRRKAPFALVAAGVFVIGVLPVLGLAPFNGQTISTVSDRFLYLSMLGPAILLAELARRCSPRVGITIAIVLAIFGMRSWVRATQWRDEQTLFAYELTINPRSLPAHEVLGIAAAREGDNVLAEKHFSAAIQTKSDDPRNYFNLGNALSFQGRFEEAAPNYRVALELDKDNASILLNLGIALHYAGQSEEAIPYLERVLQMQPNLALAQQKLDLARRATTAPTTQPAP